MGKTKMRKTPPSTGKSRNIAVYFVELLGVGDEGRAFGTEIPPLYILMLLSTIASVPSVGLVIFFCISRNNGGS